MLNIVEQHRNFDIITLNHTMKDFNSYDKLTVPYSNPNKGVVLKPYLPSELWCQAIYAYRYHPWVAVYLSKEGMKDMAVVVYTTSHIEVGENIDLETAILNE